MRFLLTLLLLTGCATAPKYACPVVEIERYGSMKGKELRKIDAITIFNAQNYCRSKPANNPNKCLIRLDIYPNLHYFALCGPKREVTEDGAAPRPAASSPSEGRASDARRGADARAERSPVEASSAGGPVMENRWFRQSHDPG